MKQDRLNFSRSLDWNLLKTFKEVVESQGITAASYALSRKQSTISLALKRLEDSLGFRLCKRGPGGFELSDEGQVVYDYVSKLDDMVTEIPEKIMHLEEEVHGQLKLEIICNLVHPILDTAIQRYNQKFPKVEFYVSVKTWDVISRSVLRNEIDIGIASAPEFFADLNYEFLFSEVHRIYCGRGHPLFGKYPEHINGLSEYPFLLTGADEPEELTRFRHQYGLGEKIAGISPHLEEAKRLVISGIGICFFPEQYAAKEVKEGTLWCLMPKIPGLESKIFAITNQTPTKKLIRDNLVTELLNVKNANTYT